MAWFILSQLFSTLIQLVRIGRMSDHEKELEIMILRYQLAIVERKLQSPLRPSRAEKLTLAVLLARLKQATQRPASQLHDLLLKLVETENTALLVVTHDPELARRTDRWLELRDGALHPQGE